MEYFKMKSTFGRGIVMHKSPRTLGKKGEDHLMKVISVTINDRGNAYLATPSPFPRRSSNG